MASGHREGKGFALPAALTAWRKPLLSADHFAPANSTLAKPAASS
jgi:hypothetical protein